MTDFAREHVFQRPRVERPAERSLVKKLALVAERMAEIAGGRRKVRHEAPHLRKARIASRYPGTAEVAPRKRHPVVVATELEILVVEQVIGERIPRERQRLRIDEFRRHAGVALDPGNN